MPLSHLLMTLAVIAVWGTNFVVIRYGLDEFPPLLFATLRFGFCILPWVFVVRRPQIAWRFLVGNGIFLGVGTFGLLFIAMRADITPGVASIMIQTQAFFTIALAMLLLRERLRSYQLTGLLLCLLGLGVMFAHVDGTVTTRGLLLTLGSGLCWGIANLVAKRAGKVNMLGFLVWSSLFAIPPLLALSLWFEGGTDVLAALTAASLPAWGAAIWQGVANTLFGYGVWNWLLARHPAAVVAPFSLLVPVVGMLSSVALLGEALPPWKVQAMLLLVAGLAVVALWPRVRARFLGANT